MKNPEAKWFVLNDGSVTGPYTKTDLDSKIQEFPAPLIWGRGQSDWVNFDKWNRLLLDFEENHRRQRLQSERLWKVSVNSQELPLMTHDKMMEFLKTQTDYANILIWTEGYAEWKEIYQIHKIMDELGVSRRQHPRVPIMGTLTLEGVQGSHDARVLSISEGGLGITDGPPLKIGEKFKTILKSPNLFAPIHATAEIVYIGHDGYAGLKFVGLQSESKSAIIEYVKKFQDSKAPSPKG